MLATARISAPEHTEVVHWVISFVLVASEREIHSPSPYSYRAIVFLYTNAPLPTPAPFNLLESGRAHG
jgi:hypothetical protein